METVNKKLKSRIILIVKVFYKDKENLNTCQQKTPT